MQFQVFYRCFIFFYLFLKCLKFIVNRANVFSPLKSLPNTPMALRMSESPRFSNVRFLWVCLVSCRLSSSFKGPGFNSTSQTCCKTMSTIVATTNTQPTSLSQNMFQYGRRRCVLCWLSGFGVYPHTPKQKKHFEASEVRSQSWFCNYLTIFFNFLSVLGLKQFSHFSLLNTEPDLQKTR